MRPCLRACVCRELAEDSAALLRAALPGVRAAWPALLHADVWGSVVGMFELNNLGLAVPSPVEDFFLMVRRLCGGLRGALAARGWPLCTRQAPGCGGLFSAAEEANRMPWRLCIAAHGHVG